MKNTRSRTAANSRRERRRKESLSVFARIFGLISRVNEFARFKRRGNARSRSTPGRARGVIRMQSTASDTNRPYIEFIRVLPILQLAPNSFCRAVHVRGPILFVYVHVRTGDKGRIGKLAVDISYISTEKYLFFSPPGVNFLPHTLIFFTKKKMISRRRDLLFSPGASEFRCRLNLPTGIKFVSHARAKRVTSRNASA